MIVINPHSGGFNCICDKKDCLNEIHLSLAEKGKITDGIVFGVHPRILEELGEKKQPACVVKRWLYFCPEHEKEIVIKALDLIMNILFKKTSYCNNGNFVEGMGCWVTITASNRCLFNLQMPYEGFREVYESFQKEILLKDYFSSSYGRIIDSW